jgi:flagellar biosynthesis protein FliR
VIDLAALAPYGAAFARTAAFLSTAPLTGERGVPPRVRVAAAALFAGLFGATRARFAADQLFVVIPTELLIGAITGFGARLAVAGAEAGGHLIGIALGLGFAESYDPSLGEQSTATRRLAHALAGLAFLASGGLDAALAAMALPAPSALSLVAALAGIIDRGGEVLVVALRVAAPALIATFVSNLAAALASRAAPALNVFSVSLALALLIGTLVLRATAPSLVSDMFGIARQAVDAAGGVR